MKQKKPIPSYNFEDLVPDTRANLLVLLEENEDEDVYKQIQVTRIQLDKIVEILNISKLGISFKVFPTPLLVEVQDNE